MVEGNVDDIRGVSSVLTQWLHLKAHAHLVSWLKEVSLEVDIPFSKSTVRGQVTRWASCSKSGSISLNRSLLFLPIHLVSYVFLHELCHIRVLNHSSDFWRLLHQMDPDYRVREAEVKKAGQYVPQWVHAGPSLTVFLEPSFCPHLTLGRPPVKASKPASLFTPTHQVFMKEDEIRGIISRSRREIPIALAYTKV